MSLKIAVTGHREILKDCDIKNQMSQFLLSQTQPVELISGGALGVDQLWIEVGLELGLPVTAALPFRGYNDRWSQDQRTKYENLLARCQTVHYVCEKGYAAWKYQKRNEWMVDNCDYLVAFWNGKPSGTKNCIDYAIQIKRQIVLFPIDYKVIPLT